MKKKSKKGESSVLLLGTELRKMLNKDKKKNDQMRISPLALTEMATFFADYIEDLDIPWIVKLKWRKLTLKNKKNKKPKTVKVVECIRFIPSYKRIKEMTLEVFGEMLKVAEQSASTDKRKTIQEEDGIRSHDLMDINRKIDELF